MAPETQKKIRTAEEAVSRVIEACSKDGLLYHQNPKVVAHVSRTGKWLLYAIAALHQELNKPNDNHERPKS